MFLGKHDYLQGFSIADLHKELKWDEMCLMSIPGKVIDQMIRWSHSKGKWGGFLQADDGVKLDHNHHVTHIVNKPIDPDHLYTILLPRDLKENTNPSINNQPLFDYIQTLPKKQRPKHECTLLITFFIGDWSSLLIYSF